MIALLIEECRSVEKLATLSGNPGVADKTKAGRRAYLTQISRRYYWLEILQCAGVRSLQKFHFIILQNDFEVTLYEVIGF